MPNKRQTSQLLVSPKMLSIVALIPNTPKVTTVKKMEQQVHAIHTIKGHLLEKQKYTKHNKNRHQKTAQWQNCKIKNTILAHLHQK